MAPQQAAWHALQIDDVARRLEADTLRGLTQEEAARRLARDGPNELARGPSVRPFVILARQFRSLVIWVLVGAGLLSILLGEMVDGAAILAIVALNAAIGFFQEFRAESAVAALTRLTAPRARVVRDGRSVVLLAREVVRGDLLLLDAGDLVAADARLLDASALRTNEAPLTGESVPVEKRAEPIPADAILAERRNVAFLGTSVANGSARALIVATGMQTEVGRIALLLEDASGGETPLQHKLDRVARQLLCACLAIVLVVFGLGLWRGVPAFELFLGAVSLAVAAVPEGLPAVVTVALALGVDRMARRNALMRSLPSVETLGSTEVICTDKTGTLTVGAMTVRRLVTADAVFRVSGEGYGLEGAIVREDGAARGPGNVVDADAAQARSDATTLTDLLRTAAGCNDAELVARDGVAGIVGDPTEAALLVAAAKAGLRREAIEKEEPRLRTLPFDSERKRMSVVRRRDGRFVAYVKGAPEEVLPLCERVRVGASDEAMHDDRRAALRHTCALLAADGLRVLAVAERVLDRPDEPEVEAHLTFLGLAALQDPPRAEARDAVARCHRAGIRVVMISGDHRDTAAAIARELGILDSADEVLVGRDLERLDDAALAERVARVAVYARVSPEHKLRIVRAWKARGAVVAMTGDGVNDAPALREASIGVAMGVAGTEVAKEAADMVLADDNFASIVAAVEEGRGVVDNVTKTLSYLLAGNTAELLVVLGATVLGYPLPLLPIQLLWVNLVTDGLPALALATDPIEPDVLNRPPNRPDAALADRGRVAVVLVAGCLTAAVSLGVFVFELARGAELASARDATFSTLVVAELVRSFGARSDTKLVSEVGLLSNLRLLGIVVASFALQIAIHHSDALRRIFGVAPVSWTECLGWIALGLVPLLSLEALKGWRRRSGRLGRSPAYANVDGGPAPP